MGSFGNNKSPWEKAAKQSSKQSPANKQPSAPPLPNPKIKSPGEESLEEVLGEMSRAMLENPDALPGKVIDQAASAIESAASAEPDFFDKKQKEIEEDEAFQQYKADFEVSYKEGISMEEAAARREAQEAEAAEREKQEEYETLFGEDVYTDHKNQGPQQPTKEQVEQWEMADEAARREVENRNPFNPNQSSDLERPQAPDEAVSLVELLTAIATDLSEIKDLMSGDGEGQYHG